MRMLRVVRNTAWWKGRKLTGRVRLVQRGIRGSVLGKDRHGRRVSYTRGETQNADQSRTSHRTHTRNTYLHTRELDDHFCADHDVAGDAVYAGASAVDLGAALVGGHRNEPAILCFCPFP